MKIAVERNRYERIRPFRIEWAWLSTIKRGWLEIQVKRLIVRLFPI